MTKYKYLFKTRSGLKVSFNASNIRYARQRLANTYNVKQNDLKLVKRTRIKN